MSKTKLTNIPTHLITGFLGVGKTSTILHLLSQKPAHEKWAVLVNEFGSVGIDGAIYRSQGIAVQEIPGGCMCCAAGVPLQVAINRTLTATRPQRLLIEPSGLGHPRRVLDTLQGEHFQGVLDMHATMCLVDPRNINDKRYITHETFIDQVMLADILIANKADLCDAETLACFYQFVEKLKPPKQAVVEARFGQIDVSWLDKRIQTKRHAHYPEHHATQPTSAIAPSSPSTPSASTPPTINSIQTLPTNSSAHNDGYHSLGWSYPEDTVFDMDKLSALFKQLGETGVERIKAVVHTQQGWKVFNNHTLHTTVSDIKQARDNRIELIYALEVPANNIQGDNTMHSDTMPIDEYHIKQALDRCIHSAADHN